MDLFVCMIGVHHHPNVISLHSAKIVTASSKYDSIVSPASSNPSSKSR